jgi:hypothetical protein
MQNPLFFIRLLNHWRVRAEVCEMAATKGGTEDLSPICLLAIAKAVRLCMRDLRLLTHEEICPDDPAILPLLAELDKLQSSQGRDAQATLEPSEDLRPAEAA